MLRAKCHSWYHLALQKVFTLEGKSGWQTDTGLLVKSLERMCFQPLRRIKVTAGVYSTPCHLAKWLVEWISHSLEKVKNQSSSQEMETSYLLQTPAESWPVFIYKCHGSPRVFCWWVCKFYLTWLIYDITITLLYSCIEEYMARNHQKSLIRWFWPKLPVVHHA